MHFYCFNTGCITGRITCLNYRRNNPIFLNNKILLPPTEGDTGIPPTDQGIIGGPLPEFDYLTGGDPGAPVIQATDPAGQYCNPTVESCDPAFVSPGGCFTDITTHAHASKCDYSNRGSKAPPEGVTNGDLVRMGVTDCDPSTQSSTPDTDGGAGGPKPDRCEPPAEVGPTHNTPHKKFTESAAIKLHPTK